MMKKIAAVALAVAVIGGLSIAGIRYAGTAEAGTTTSTQDGRGFSGGPGGGEMGMPGGNQGQGPGGMGGMGRGGNMLSDIREKIEALEDGDTKTELLEKLEKVENLQEDERTAMEELMSALKEAGVISEDEMFGGRGNRPDMQGQDGNAPTGQTPPDGSAPTGQAPTDSNASADQT